MMNTDHANVQEPGDAWEDPRVERTTRAVMVALRELLPDVPYRELTVQQILDRAGVSRATFYKHYRGKDDAFRASLAGMLARLQRHPERGARLFAVRELIDHVANATALRASLSDSERIERIWDDIREELTPCLVAELKAAPGSLPEAPTLAARVLAGALVELIRWVVETSPPIATETLDARFHRMAATTLAAFGCVRRSA